MGEDSSGGSRGSEKFVSKKTISIIYFGGLLLALLILWGLFYFDPGMIAVIHMYPLGCTVFLGFLVDEFIWLGYFVYPVIYICAYKNRQKRAFITLLIIYIIILCLNVVGCEMFEDFYDFY